MCAINSVLIARSISAGPVALCTIPSVLIARSMSAGPVALCTIPSVLMARTMSAGPVALCTHIIIFTSTSLIEVNVIIKLFMGFIKL